MEGLFSTVLPRLCLFSLPDRAVSFRMATCRIGKEGQDNYVRSHLSIMATMAVSLELQQLQEKVEMRHYKHNCSMEKVKSSHISGTIEKTQKSRSSILTLSVGCLVARDPPISTHV